MMTGIVWAHCVFILSTIIMQKTHPTSSSSQMQWWQLVMGVVSRSGTTLLFGCTNMTKWSVCSPKVYKPSLLLVIPQVHPHINYLMSYN